MADNYVQAPPDSLGKKIDTESLTVGADEVHRQRIQICGDGATEVAELTNTTPGSNVYGLVVRPVPVSIAASILSGQANVATTFAALPSAAGRKVHINSLFSNTDDVMLGPSGVSTSNGFPLKIGNTVTLEVSNLSAVFAVSVSGTQRVAYLVEV